MLGIMELVFRVECVFALGVEFSSFRTLEPDLRMWTLKQVSYQSMGLLLGDSWDWVAVSIRSQSISPLGL